MVGRLRSAYHPFAQDERCGNSLVLGPKCVILGLDDDSAFIRTIICRRSWRRGCSQEGEHRYLFIAEHRLPGVSFLLGCYDRTILVCILG